MKTIDTTTLGVASGRAGGRIRMQQAVEILSDICGSLSPGDRLPTHTELMRRLNMPERTVLAALKELYRLGRVERIQGSGTYVAELSKGEGVKVKDVDRQERARKTIVALARPDHSFYDRSIQRLSSHIAAASLELVVRPVPHDREINELAATLDPAGGYIVFGNALTELGALLLKSGHRVVNVGTPKSGTYAEVPTIYSDQEAGGYAVASHLISLGHRRIAFAHDDPEDLRTTMRWSGHMRAIVEAQRTGVQIYSTIIDQEQYQRLDLQSSAATEYFTGPDAVTAVVAWNDIDAVRMLSLFARHGISVPQQVSLTGYDASDHGAIVYPSLTTVDNSLDKLLKAAVDLLTNPTPPPASYVVVMHPTLITRESSGPLLTREK